MNRGDIVTVATKSGLGGKPRPALVIQNDRYSALTTVVLALVSSDPAAARISINVPIIPSVQNGLVRPSWVMVHSIATARIDEVGKLIGTVERMTLHAVDQALLIFLGLAS